MKKQLPPNFEHTTLDGWICLAPGESMCECVDTPISPTVFQQRALIQSVRGFVLSAGFDIENNAIRLQLAHAFGTTDRSKGGAAFVEKEEYLRSEGTGLIRRLDGAYSVIRDMLPAKDADALIQDLAEYRRIRHVCAHRPSWLKSIWTPDAGTMEGISKGRTTGYKLYIADATYQWEIDQPQIEEWATLLNRTIAALEKLIHAILKLDDAGRPISQSSEI